MILQFGTGNFLRGFADLFVSQCDRDPGNVLGPVVAVQSTGSHRAEALNAAGGRYHVAVQGYRDGQVINETERVDSICEALVAGAEWDRVMDTGCRSGLVAILSNTTEAGLSLDPRDRERSRQPPHSFPAKLLSVLLARRDAGLPGTWVVPCELVERNGEQLQRLVFEQARAWRIPDDGLAWLETECRWANTLVDRIVPGPPREHPLQGVDPLLLSAEPYALWAVEATEGEFPIRHPAVEIVADIAPFALRKVRILNGAHTALVSRTRGSRLETVRECVENPEVGPWLEGLLFEEIVPTLGKRCLDPAGFAREVLDRFRNPFHDHRLDTIALNHESKVAVRLEPTRREFWERFGRTPRRLTGILGGS